MSGWGMNDLEPQGKKSELDRRSEIIDAIKAVQNISESDLSADDRMFLNLAICGLAEQVANNLE